MATAISLVTLSIAYLALFATVFVKTRAMYLRLCFIAAIYLLLTFLFHPGLSEMLVKALHI